MRRRLILRGLLVALTLGAVIVALRWPITPVAPTPAAIVSPSPALGERPPIVTASYAGQEQRGALGSYCWDGCSDTYSLIPAQPITVPLSAEIEFEMGEPVPPHQLLVTLFLVDASRHVPWSDSNFIALGARSEVARATVRPATRFEFQMPDRAGDYALSVFGEWQTGDSFGPDASYGFHIVVSDSGR
jgi:hypothetical protein